MYNHGLIREQQTCALYTEVEQGIGLNEAIKAAAFTVTPPINLKEMHIQAMNTMTCSA